MNKEDVLKELNKYFDYVEISDDRVINLLFQVVSRICEFHDPEEISFGPLIGGPIFSGEAGEVTEDGDIRLDPNKLNRYDDDVVMAIIAHELAHSLLDHYSETISEDDPLIYEREADDQAQKWGFDVTKFRRICGPPTVK